LFQTCHRDPSDCLHKTMALSTASNFRSKPDGGRPGASNPPRFELSGALVDLLDPGWLDIRFIALFQTVDQGGAKFGALWPSRARTATVAGMATDDADAIPQLVKPSREIAIEIALALFERGQRVDMQTVADSLGVGRTTLYRWVGDREQLFGEVLGHLAARVWRYVNDSATGQGKEQVLRATEAFMTISSKYSPLRSFVQREPQLALRVLLRSDGLVSRRIREGAEEAFTRHMPHFDIVANRELLDTMVRIGTVLQWVPIAIGEEVSIPHEMRFVRGLLEPFGDDGRKS